MQQRWYLGGTLTSEWVWLHLAQLKEGRLILLAQASSSNAFWASNTHQSPSSMLVPPSFCLFDKLLLSECLLVPCKQDRHGSLPFWIQHSCERDRHSSNMDRDILVHTEINARQGENRERRERLPMGPDSKETGKASAHWPAIWIINCPTSLKIPHRERPWIIWVGSSYSLQPPGSG